MIRVWAPEVSRSTANWARSAPLVMVSHWDGSRLEVTIVDLAGVGSTMSDIAALGFNRSGLISS